MFSCFLFVFIQEKSGDTKGVIRSHKLKDRQHNDQKSEDTKGVIRSHKLKDRQHNDQKREDVMKNKL